MGVNSTDYERVYDFKKNVLDVAVKEINEKTDIQTSYDQVKEDAKLLGLSLLLKRNPKRQRITNVILIHQICS